MTFQRSELSWVDVELVAEATKSRTRSDAPDRIAGALRIGLPIVRAIEADELDGAAARQVRADAAAYRYSLVELACSLQPPDGRELRRAMLSVVLETTPAEEATIAYSLDPMKETIEEGRSTTLGVSAELGLFTISAEHERSKTVRIASVVAYGARTPAPSWELVRADGHELRGSYYFALIARAPIRARTTGRVGLSATIEKWRFRTYEASVPEATTFTIGGAA